MVKVINQTLNVVDFLRATLLDVNRELRLICKTESYSKKNELLRSVPGVGLVTALTLLSEIGDFNRIKNWDRFCSYVGLVPTTHSSGDKDISGEITPRANKSIRSVIIESAWIAIGIDPTLAKRYNELCSRMKVNDAIVRIAKKLLSRIRSIMKNEVHYEYSI
jgi:transposase